MGTDISVRTGRRVCAARYAELARRCATDGIRRRDVEQSRDLYSRHTARHAWLTIPAYRPTGVALGYPLPDAAFTCALHAALLRTDRFLQELVNQKGPALALVPPRRYHVTIVNKDHFDIGMRRTSVQQMTRTEALQVDRLVRHRYGPIAIRFKGLLLTAHGRLLVPGYPRHARLFALRRALVIGVPALAANMPVTAHIKIAHLLRPVDRDRLEELLSWLAAHGSTLGATLVFRDVHTSWGRIPL